MGAICGSTKDAIQPISLQKNKEKYNYKMIRRNKDKKLTSLEDIIKVKHRRNSEDAIMNALLKRKIYQRKFSLLIKNLNPQSQGQNITLKINIPNHDNIKTQQSSINQNNQQINKK